MILKESCSAEQLGVELLGPPVTPEKLRATKTFTQSALAPDSHVVSDLVPEPLLWDGRKFHLRIYILIHLKAGRAYAHLHEKFVWVITSAKPYVAGEWEDRDIHLSGASRSLRDPSTQGKMLYCWLQDGAKGVGWTQEQVEKSWEALKEMSTPIAMALASNWKPFQESSGGYKYYGVDAMLSADGRPWLLEVNNRPAWGSSKYIYPWLAEELIQWGLKTAASPHFGLASTASPFWEGPAALVPGPLKDIPSGLSLAPDDGRSDGSTRTWKVLHRVGEAGEAGEAGEVGEVVMGKNGRVRYEFKDAGLAAAGVTLAIEAYVALNPTGSSAPGTPNPDVSIRADQDPHDLRRRLNFSEAPDGVWVRPGRQSASSGRREIDEHSSRQYRSAVMSAVPDFVPKSARQRAVPGVEPPRWELYTASEKEKLTQVLAENPGRAFAAEDLLVDLATGRTPYFGEAPPYRTRKDAKMEYRTRNVHQGQRKLFLTELYLLSTRGADLIAGAKPAEPAVLLYAGAACGQHLVLLAELFPWIQFHLYDPAPFTPAVVKHPRLHTYREFFTDEVAAAWGKDGKLARCHGRPAFFLSDIRLGNSDLVAMEKQIVGDMEAQQTWVEIIRPTRASMLKFRPEYREVDGEGRERRGVELRYLQGEVLFQCWGPTFSTERRLIVSSTPRVGDGGCELAYAIYDVGTYDALSSAHNLLVRPWVRFHDLRLDVERAGGHGPSAAEVGLSWEVRAEAATWELYLAALPGGTVTPRAIAKHMRELSDCLGRKFADHFARARTPAEAVEPAEPSERRMSGVVGAIVSTDDTFLKRPTVSLRIPQILRDTDLDLVDIFATAGFAEDSSALEVHPREAAKRFASLAWSEPSGVAEFFHKQIAQYFKQPAELKNFLDDGKREATFKLNMYRSLQRNDPDFLNYTPETWDFTKLDPQALPFDAKTPVFLKASVGFGQTGVVTVSPPVTHKSLAALIEGLQATRKVKGRTGEEDYVISRHIPNALLWYEDGEEAGRKFHIRVYAIASVEGGRAYVQVHNRLAWVLTAAEPYERSRHPDKTDAEYWSDLDIHLTGGSRTPRSIEWFAEGAEHVKWTPDQMTRAWASVEKVAGQVTRIIAQNAAPYEEANSAYEIFGLDIMFDRSGQAWLIEINANSSWCRNNQMSPRVITEMLDWSLATTILPHFGLAPRPLPAWEGPAVAHGPLRNMPPGLTLRPSVAAGASRAKTSLTWEVVHTAPETDPSVTVVGTVSFSEKRELSYAGNNRDVLLYGLALALEVLAARYAPRNPEVSLTGDPLKLATDLGFRKTSEGSRRVLRKTNKRPQKAASVRQMVRIAPAIGGGGGSDRGGGSSDRGDGGGARSRSLVCAARLPQIRAEISYDPIAAFAKRGFTEADLETARFVHLAWTESSSPGRWGKIQKKQFESLSAELKSTLGLQKRAATDKSLLYQNLKRVDPAADDYLPRTWPLAELLDTGDAGARARAALGSGPVIMKVPNSFAQRGVTVHGSFDPAAMRSAAGDSVPKSGGDMIVSDLVRDPLLWDGKKFHLRIYLLVAVGAKSGGARRAYAYVNRERVEVYTARLPFVEPGPDPAPANPDIHMSGGSRTEREYLWFRDAPHHTEWDGAQAAKAWEGALTALRAGGADHRRVRSPVRGVSRGLRGLRRRPDVRPLRPGLATRGERPPGLAPARGRPRRGQDLSRPRRVSRRVGTECRHLSPLRDTAAPPAALARSEPSRGAHADPFPFRGEWVCVSVLVHAQAPGLSV